MFDLWKQELTPEETDALIDKAAAEIRKRKLELPALLMLEAHKPLSFVGSQMLVAMSPMVVPFLGFDFVNDYSRLASKPENIERLLAKLEQPAVTPPSGGLEDSCSTTTLDG